MDHLTKFLSLILWTYSFCIATLIIWWKITENNSGTYFKKQREQLVDLIDYFGWVELFLNPYRFILLFGSILNQFKAIAHYRYKAYRTFKNLQKEFEEFSHYVTYGRILEPLNPVFYKDLMETFAKNFKTDLQNLKSYEELLGIKCSAQSITESENWGVVEKINNQNWKFIADDSSTKKPTSFV